MAERGGPRTLVKGQGFRERMPPNPQPPSVPSMPVRSSCPAPSGPGQEPVAGERNLLGECGPARLWMGGGVLGVEAPEPHAPLRTRPARPRPPPGSPQGPGTRPSLEQVEEALVGEK